jgi:aldehyde:ferredoxin oxidoreductase
MAILLVDTKGFQIITMPELKGKCNYETAENLRRRFGNKVSVISIGPCGELGMKSATAAFTDSEGRPCRHAARGGLGAVMGSKGLKAIVVDSGELPVRKPEDPEAFHKSIKALVKLIRGAQGVPSYRTKYGTSGAMKSMNALGCLPTRNFKEGSFGAAGKISGEALKELRQVRGGRMHGCMPGCVVKCSNEFYDRDGKYLTAALEYETISLLGCNLDIADLDTIAQMDRICDDLGLDTIEIGNALGLFMEAGILQFGQRKETIELLREAGKGTKRGRILADGAVSSGEFLNIKRIAHAKGQGLPAHDPRISKAAGVTYCTSPMGGDHTAGVDYTGDPTDRETAIQKSLEVQILVALIDTLGYCLLAMPLNKKTIIEPFADILNAYFGTKLYPEQIVEIGRQVIVDELTFNENAGLPSDKSYLPEFLFTEALLPRAAVFDVDKQEVNKIWNKLLK